MVADGAAGAWHLLTGPPHAQVHEGTLAQVQAQVEEHLRARHVGTVAFFGQHMGGGLLDKSKGLRDGTFADLVKHMMLLPEDVRARDDVGIVFQIRV